MPNQRDIFLIPFPYADLETEKSRPALVISNSVFNAQFDEIVVMGVTSNLDSPLPGVCFDSAHLEAGEIARPSKILISKLWAIEKQRVGPFYARLNAATFREVLGELDRLVR